MTVTDPIAFIKRFIRRTSTGQPFEMLPIWDVVLSLAFQFDSRHRLPWDTILLSTVKKSAKTETNAQLVTARGFTQEAPNEILLCANDLEQSQGRVFKAVCGLIEHNPVLRREAEVGARQVTLSNGTTITAIASEYAGATGSNHGLTSWDEQWAYMSEASRRLWEELTPVPTRHNSIRIVSTTAGIEGESALLQEVYKSGVGTDEHPEGQGERLHPTLPIYGNRDARIFAYWDHEPRAPWQTPDYYAAQRRSLRPSTYLRLHENRWTTGVETFITGELWDPCVDRDYFAPLRPPGPVYLGIDASLKHDTAAVMAIAVSRDRLSLVAHRLWKPTEAEPLDLEATIETYVRELCGRMDVREILCDPWQMARSIATLKAAGLPIREFPQTTGNCTLMGQALFDALKGRQVRLYADEELRQQALNTVAVESSRGWRIAKEKASRKIDAIVALALAVVTALRRPAPMSRELIAACLAAGEHEVNSLWRDAPTPSDGLRGPFD